MLNVDALLAIMDSIKKNGIAELKITHDAVELRTFATGAPTAPVAAPAPVPAAAPAPAPTPEAAPTPAAAPAAAPAAQEPKKEEAPAAAAPAGSGKLETVEIPIPGTIFVAPAKDLDGNPLPAVGDKVKEGQVIALLEAMKMYNEIFAPVSGTIREIRQNNESPVNPGDILMTIEVE